MFGKIRGIREIREVINHINSCESCKKHQEEIEKHFSEVKYGMDKKTIFEPQADK